MATPRWAVLRQNSGAENLHLAPVNNSNPADVNYSSGIILEPGGELVLPGKSNMRIADEINYLKSSVVNGKYAIAQAISGKGVPAAGGEEFGTLAAKIGQISTSGKKQFSNGWVQMPITNDPWTISLPFTPAVVHIQIYVVAGYMRTDTNTLDYNESYHLITITHATSSSLYNSRQSWNGFLASYNYASAHQSIRPDYSNRNIAIDFNNIPASTYGSRIITNGFICDDHNYSGDYPGNYGAINYAAYE